MDEGRHDQTRFPLLCRLRAVRTPVAETAPSELSTTKQTALIDRSASTYHHRVRHRPLFGSLDRQSYGGLGEKGQPCRRRQIQMQESKNSGVVGALAVIELIGKVVVDRKRWARRRQSWNYYCVGQVQVVRSCLDWGCPRVCQISG